MWVFNEPGCVNAFSQIEQENAKIEKKVINHFGMRTIRKFNRNFLTFVTCMILHMLNQFTGLLECFSTDRALVKIGVGVRELMFSQQCGRFETFVAVFAREWICFIVRFHMQNQAA